MKIQTENTQKTRPVKTASAQPKRSPKAADDGAAPRGAKTPRQKARGQGARGRKAPVQGAARRGRPRLSEEERNRRKNAFAIYKWNLDAAMQTMGYVQGRPKPGMESHIVEPGYRIATAADSGPAAEAASEAISAAGGPPRRHLPSHVKQFIVIHNALYRRPRDIIQMVRERFGITISSPQVARYDLSKKAGQTMRYELRCLFDATRREARDARSHWS